MNRSRVMDLKATVIRYKKSLVIAVTFVLILVVLISAYSLNRHRLGLQSDAAATLPPIYPVADTYVDADKPEKNFGADGTLLVDGSPNRVVYMKFDLGSIDVQTIKSLRLKLFVTDPTKAKIFVRTVSGQWDESTLVYKNRPQPSKELLTTFSGGAIGSEIQVDISKVLASSKNRTFTVYFEPTSSYKFGIGSKESAHKPALLVVQKAGTDAPTSTPSVSPSATAAGPIATVKPSIVSPTPSTVTPTPSPSPVITTVPVSAKKGIWISQEEIMKLPMAGGTWDAMKKVADSDIGAANMSDQDSAHPEKLVALSLVAIRTQSEGYKTKAVNELMEAIGTENNPDADCASSQFGARGLAVGRNLIGYAISADILNFRAEGYDPSGKGTKFMQWVDTVRHRKNCDSNGAAAYSDDISAGHDGTTSNGNALSGASRIASAGYLGDKAELDKAWLTFRRYAGDTSVGPAFKPNSFSRNWKVSENPYVGINPKGAHCSGSSSSYPADGVLPNDQGRGSDCPSAVGKLPTYTAYPWEGLQGAYAQAFMLDRLGYRDPSGKSPWQVSDSALLRAVQYQWYLQTLCNTVKCSDAWYDGNRAAWVKHLAYKVYGFKPVQYDSSGGGRNMDWTQWTVQ